MSRMSEIISTTEGAVRGRREGDVLRWKSIPYAAAPVGSLRWRAPQPAQPWPGVRNAIHFGAASCQATWGAGLASGQGEHQRIGEDCLTLNVTAPANSSTSPRPVMVFIHGGGYLVGTSALSLYSGKTLVHRGDVVFVSLNYRLGALGYLDLSLFSTPGRPIESNLGLRDQVAALEWVQRNVAAFGGDPENVTVFGESAGANAVTTLMVTPAAKGLFHRAIAQSAPARWAHGLDESAQWAREFVDLLGATPETAVRALESASPRDLGRAATKLYRQEAKRSISFPLQPVVDGEYLPKWPIEAFRDGSAHRVPLIIGTNRNEGTLFARIPDAMPTNPKRISFMFQTTYPAAERRVISTYPGYPSVRSAIALGGDAVFWYPSVEVAAAHSSYAPTYSYRYDFATRLLRRIGLGATHATEMISVFGAVDTAAGRAITSIGSRSELRVVTSTVQDHWLSFARYGAPLPAWPTYGTDDRATLIIDAPSRVEHDPHADRRRAWAEYRSSYGERGPEISRTV